MPTLTECVESYMYTDEISSLARTTRVRTKIVLTDLIKVAGPKLIVSRLNRSHVDKTVAAWRARKLTESSINNYKASLRLFCAYLLETRLNREDVGKHLKTVKTVVNYAKRKPLTASQARKVILAAGMFHERDRVSVLLALYTGLRAMELCSLTWADVDLPARVIYANRSKVSDVHIVPVADELAGHLVAWRATYERLSGPLSGSEYVVPALLNQPPMPGVVRPSHTLRLSPYARQTNLRQRVKGYMRTAGVAGWEILGVHALRRTAGNLLLDSGADVRDVQQLLGHASERQTQVYLSRDNAREKLADRMRDWRI